MATCRKGADSTSVSDGCKRKRSHKPLTLNAKLEMIGLSEQGLTRAEISRKLGVPRPTVSTVVNAKEKVLKEVSSATPLNTTLIRKRDSIIADMEKLLLVWIKDQTSHSIPVTQAIIQDKALSLFNAMKDERGKAAAENKFRASRGWFTRFKKRSGLHNTSVQDEVLGADGNHAVAPEDYPREFYKIIEDCGYINQQIFTVTEAAVYGNKKPSKTYIIKENSIAELKATKNKHNLKHTEDFEDFENPDEKDTSDVAEIIEEFEVKVEPDDEVDMDSNDKTMTDSEDDLPVQQRRTPLEVEFHPNDNPDILREIATKELEDAINCIEIGMSAFETLDPNFERSSAVNASILNGISCYKEILKEKRQFMKHSLSVSNSEKLSAPHLSATASSKKSSVLTAKKPPRDVSKSPSSKLVKCIESSDKNAPSSVLQ